ncbi:nuclear transport factor 2 family protein [Glycomyces sp. NPDC049804]|uniref:nuclear transport factor 2 family protein n=1 Tax=Glycomyces sp. NPDC049804 TaxID=3154363 RepID=UPI0034489805
MPRHDRIRDLTDRAALEQLVNRHSRWIDEHRFDETDQLFTTDVHVASPLGEARGIDELNALAASGDPHQEATLHSKSGALIDIDGDTATLRTNDIAILLHADKAGIAAAVHHYEAVRTEQGWRFSKLRIQPVLPARPGAPAP